MSTKPTRKPEMIGAHPKNNAVFTTRKRPQTYADAREFTAAYDAWNRRKSGTMLVHHNLAPSP